MATTRIIIIVTILPHIRLNEIPSSVCMTSMIVIICLTTMTVVLLVEHYELSVCEYGYIYCLDDLSSLIY